jgi:hypothetical protein
LLLVVVVCTNVVGGARDTCSIHCIATAAGAADAVATTKLRCFLPRCIPTSSNSHLLLLLLLETCIAGERL